MSADSPIVQEIRQRAMEISTEFGHDMRKYGEYLRRNQQQAQYRKRVVSQLTVVSLPRGSEATTPSGSLPGDHRQETPTP